MCVLYLKVLKNPSIPLQVRRDERLCCKNAQSFLIMRAAPEMFFLFVCLFLSSALNTGVASHGDCVVSGEMLWQSVLPCQQHPTSAERKAKASYGITAAVFYWVRYEGTESIKTARKSRNVWFRGTMTGSGGKKSGFSSCVSKLFNSLSRCFLSEEHQAQNAFIYLLLFLIVTVDNFPADLTKIQSLTPEEAAGLKWSKKKICTV